MSSTPDPWPPPGQYPPAPPPSWFLSGPVGQNVSSDDTPTVPGIQVPPAPPPPPDVPRPVDPTLSYDETPTLPGIQLPPPAAESSEKRTMILSGVAVVLLICLIAGIIGAALRADDTRHHAGAVTSTSPTSSTPPATAPAVPAPTTRPATPSPTTSAKPKPSPKGPSPTRPSPTSTTTKPSPRPTTTTPPAGGGTDPRYRTCAEAKRRGYGPYYRGQDPEYAWYKDPDKDGVVCE